MRLLLILILLLSSFLSLAQLKFRNGAYSEAICNASVTLRSSEAIFHNQAAAASINSTQFIIAYKNRFGLKELAIQSIGANTPLLQGNTFITYSETGNSTWHESMITTGYARAMSKNWLTSFAFHYFNQSLAEKNEATRYLTFSLGLLLTFQKVNFGLHLFNPFSQNYPIALNHISHPYQLRIGGSYQVSQMVTIYTETRHNKQQKLPFIFGIEFHLKQNLTLLGGISTNTIKQSLGISYRYQNFTGTFSFASQQKLGFSPVFTLKYQLQ